MKGLPRFAAGLPALLDRWKYPALILLAGLVLLLWPAGKGEDPEPAQTEPASAACGESEEAYRLRTERQLEALLSQVEGAGRVKVMLSLQTGPAVQYQTDSSRSQSREGDREQSAAEEKTVMQSRGSAYTEPAVVSTALPVFRGALIVAEGGADPGVRYQLSAAVSGLLGLGTDQITVVKMKEKGN